MSFCASYVVCFFSRACVFFEDTCVQKQKKKSKKLAGEKCITFLISNACSNSLSTARWIWSLENWFIMSFDVWECIFTRSSARSKTVKFLCFVVERKEVFQVWRYLQQLWRRDAFLCVFLNFFLNFFSPSLFFSSKIRTHTSFSSSLCSQGAKKTRSFCVSIFYACT